MLAALPGVSAAAGLLFRHGSYHRIPVHPGDAYGAGDLLDLGFALLVLATSASALLAALLILLRRKQGWQGSALWLMTGSTLAAGLYFALHSHV